MAAMIEREVKLPFASVEAARQAILSTGATALRGRRLQEDCLLDTRDSILRQRRCVLRVRMESGKSVLTFKGPVQPSTLKVREELETIASDGLLLLRILEELGFGVWFRYEKYREEFAIDDVILALDETPLGVFVELEGGDRGIAHVAQALGCGPGDYLIDSYRTLYTQHCERCGISSADMLFEAT
jgi:adenylate cyclase class 2